MKSLKELYRIGKGPSSSHTMGPQRAARLFAARCPKACSFEVTLYGSLAATGKGHMTDIAIKEVLSVVAPLEIKWKPDIVLPFHPNGMKFVAYDAAHKTIDEWTVYSIGGGALSEGQGRGDMFDSGETYSLNTLTEIMRWCYDNGRSYWEYVQTC